MGFCSAIGGCPTHPMQLRVRETPPPTCFAGHLLPQGEEAGSGLEPQRPGFLHVGQGLDLGEQGVAGFLVDADQEITVTVYEIDCGARVGP